MSNIAKLYNELTSSPEEVLPEEVLDAGAKELKFNWLNSSITQEVFKSIVEDENQLISYAIEQACKKSPDAMLLVQVLIRVDTLRKLRKDFSNQQNINNQTQESK